MTMRAGYMPLGLAGTWIQNGQPVSVPFFMPADYYEQIQDEVPWIFEDLQLLEQLINVEPRGVVFENLNREGHEHACCYSCVPAMAVQPGVLVGFVDQSPSHSFAGPVLFWLEWRDEDEYHPCHPVGWREDFGGVLWTRQ